MISQSPTRLAWKSSLSFALCLVGSLALMGCEIDLKEGKYVGTVSGSKTDVNGTVEINNGGATMYIELTNDMPGNRADSYVFRLCEDLLPKYGVEGCENTYYVDVNDNVFSQYIEDQWMSYEYKEESPYGGYYYYYCYYTESVQLVGEFTNDHQVEFRMEYSTKDDVGSEGCRDLAGAPRSMTVEGIVTLQ